MAEHVSDNKVLSIATRPFTSTFWGERVGWDIDLDPQLLQPGWQT